MSARVLISVGQWSPELAVREATFDRHRGQWWSCGDSAPHSEHQLCYDPWKACPGVRPPEAEQ